MLYQNTFFYKDEGHQILKLIDNDDGTYEMFIKKVGD